MFKDARALDRQRTATSFDRQMTAYARQAESWFDGSVGSVDRRLAHCDRLLHAASFHTARLAMTDGNRYLQATAQLQSDREVLAALRDDLLTGGANRQDVVGPPGWRSAAITDPDPADQEGVDEAGWNAWKKRNLDENGEVLGNPNSRKERERRRDEAYQAWIDSGAPHHGGTDFTPGNKHVRRERPSWEPPAHELGEPDWVPLQQKVRGDFREEMDALEDAATDPSAPGFRQHGAKTKPVPKRVLKHWKQDDQGRWFDTRYDEESNMAGPWDEPFDDEFEKDAW